MKPLRKKKAQEGELSCSSNGRGEDEGERCEAIKEEALNKEERSVIKRKRHDTIEEEA